jgi:hypothetical protein
MKRLAIVLGILFVSGLISAQVINPGGGGSTTVPWTSATTPNATTGATVTLPTFTSSVTGFTISGTWNSNIVWPGMFVVNANNTLSAAGSKIFDAQLSGTSKANIQSDGTLHFGSGTGPTALGLSFIAGESGNNAGLWLNGTTQLNFAVLGTNFTTLTGSKLNVAQNMNVGWSTNAFDSSNGNDTGLARNAAGIVEINNGTGGTFVDIKYRNALATTSSPATSSCGTGNGSVAAGSTNESGQFTTGTVSLSSCTVTFSTNNSVAGWPNNAWCTISPANSAAAVAGPYISASSKTAFTVTTTIVSATFNYTCHGN